MQEDDSRVLRATAPYEDCSGRFQLKVAPRSLHFTNIDHSSLQI
jgi:hypothetical protein